MKEVADKIEETALMKAFSDSQSVQRSDLRKYYEQHSQAATDQAFRRFLYRLEKHQVIAPVGAGVYALHDPGSQGARQKNQFSPTWSSELIQLNDAFRKAFQYAWYLLWETRVLHEFMLLQPGQNFYILETEKDVGESAFNFLSHEYSGRVFLEPDRETMKRYVLSRPDSILVSRLVTESPKRTIQGVPSPKLEKILVDLFTDEDRFYYFQGAELARIFENAFSAHPISVKTLFRYARRRKASTKLRKFIHEQTQIELPRFVEEKE
jgi:hypothetical protein